MEVAEDFFAVPAFGTFPGVASQGCREETPLPRRGMGGCLPAATPDIVPAFAPRHRLRLGGEQEETSTRKQICWISRIRKAFGPGSPGLSQDSRLSGAAIAGRRRQPGAGLSRRARKSARCANQLQPLDETLAFWALLFIEKQR